MGYGFEFHSKYECRLAMFHAVLCCLAEVRVVQESDTRSNNPFQMPTDLQFQNEFQTGTERRAKCKKSKGRPKYNVCKKNCSYIYCCSCGVMLGGKIAHCSCMKRKCKQNIGKVYFN